MKKLIFPSILAITLWNTEVKAQASASFTASVTIIQPIGITTTSNMNFASIDARNGGTITLSPDNLRITTGGVTLKDEIKLSAATFLVTGEQDFAFSIGLPANEYILTNGRENLIIKDFTSSLTDSESLNSGSKTVSVGATLDVNPNQEPGIYTCTGPLDVTVNYN